MHFIVQSQRLSVFFFHSAVFFEIHFVSNQDLSHVVSCVLLDRFYPGVNVIEGSLLCYIVSDDHAICFFIERVRKGLESLLASCVPNFDSKVSAVLSFVFLNHEVEAQCGNVLIVEPLIVKLLDHGGFADCSIA